MKYAAASKGLLLRGLGNEAVDGGEGSPLLFVRIYAHDYR